MRISLKNFPANHNLFVRKEPLQPSQLLLELAEDLLHNPEKKFHKAPEPISYTKGSIVDIYA
jgi:hypothetical protein